MHFLLESLGFPPGTDFVRLAAEVARTERRGQSFELLGGLGLRAEQAPVPGRSAAQSEAPQDLPIDLWPSFRGASPVRLTVASVERSLDCGGLVTVQGRVGSILEPNPLDLPVAFLEDEAPVAGDVGQVHLCGFSVDVDALGFPSQPCAETNQLRAENRIHGQLDGLGAGRIYPGRLAGPEDAPRLKRLPGFAAPRHVVELEFTIDRVFVLENPLTHEPFDLIETRTGDTRLPLFVSRWQLEEDGFPAPEPGMRLRGAFWLGARPSRG